MKQNHLALAAKAAALAAAISMTSHAFAEGQASRKSDATPVEDYSVSKDDGRSTSRSTEHRHNGKVIDVPHAVLHRRSPTPLPYTGIDYTEDTAAENKRKFFGDN